MQLYKPPESTKYIFGKYGIDFILAIISNNKSLFKYLEQIDISVGFSRRFQLLVRESTAKKAKNGKQAQTQTGTDKTGSQKVIEIKPMKLISLAKTGVTQQ